MNVDEILARISTAKKSGNGWAAKCPAHDDGTASLSISEGDDGRTLLHCHRGCTTEAICTKLNLAMADLFPAKATRNDSGKHIVATYDYHDASGKVAFQVVRYAPKDFRQRRPDATAPDGWTWKTSGIEKVLYRLPEIVRAITGGKFIFLCEGEKDVLAMVQRGFDATCNCGGAATNANDKKWQDGYTETLRGSNVAIIADKDEAGRTHAQIVAGKLHGVAKSVRIIELPDSNGKPVKDAADYFAAGGTVENINAQVDTARQWTPQAAQPDAMPELPRTDAIESKQRVLTLRSPDDLLAMSFDDSDVILGDRLLAKGQPLVIAAQGGTGKSRLALQIVAAIVTGRKCLAFETGGTEMRWLILQTENSNRRLQQDIARIKTWLGDDWPRFAEQVVFHTIENDNDGFVSLESPENQLAIQRTIESANPDGIVIDPLNDFAAGDLNKDADMRATLQTLSRLCRQGKPDRAIVVLHHSLTGKAGASKATGFDRASFARNSKTLHAWTRGQINLAAVDADNNDRLIVACGKCSNGKEFQTFAVRLNPGLMIYEVDPTVDLNQWERTITGTKDNAPLMNSDRVRELCAVAGSSKPALAKSITEDCGCVRGSAYRYITRAEQAKKIIFNKSNETYFRK